jgi:D-alanyl-D-alanine carboxypeptidase/D-alanyl-D-alanine-endopeptidase (penicillin-binding protein 4)
MPASTVKIITAYAALSYLKTDFTYQTAINQHDDNSLYLTFSGDPTLTLENLQNLTSTLTQQQKNSKIIIDDRVFDEIYQGPGWAWDDSKFCYSAPISGANIDKNCFKFNFTALNPSPIFAKITNNLTTHNNVPTCLADLKAENDNTYILSGCMDAALPLSSLHIAYQNPKQYIKDVVQFLFNKQSITFGHTPKTSQQIAIHYSKALPEIARNMLKTSDNLIAESLLKTLGSQYYHSQGSFENGITALKDILKDQQWLTQLKLVDGSGLSRYNLISPHDFVQLLSAIYRNKALFPVILDILPPLIHDNKPYPQIRVKTGGMSGVRNIVGFVSTKHHGLVAFAIMINNFTTPSEAFRQLQDNILLMLLDY